MSTLKLEVKYGGHWAGLEYIGGEDDIAFVPPGEGGYQALWDSVHHCMNVDTNSYRYIFEAYVDLNDNRIRKRKLKTDDDVFELFRKERYPVVFVSVRSIRPTTNFVSNTNIYVDEGTSSYRPQHAIPQHAIVPLEKNSELDGQREMHVYEDQMEYNPSVDFGDQMEYNPSVDFGDEWGLHGHRDLNMDADDIPEAATEANVEHPVDHPEAATEANVEPPADHPVEEDGNVTCQGDIINVRAQFEDFIAWYYRPKGTSSETHNSTFPITFPPYQRQQPTSAGNTSLDCDVLRNSRWLIPGAPTTFIDNGPTVQEGGLFLNSGAITVGAMYSTKEQLTTAIGLYHVDKIGEYRVQYSDKKRMKVVCKSKQCNFTVASSAARGIWSVYKMIDHNCTLDPTRSGPRRLPSKILGAYFAPRLLEQNSTLNTRAMMSELQQRNSIHASYDQVLRAKHHAIKYIFGDENESFANLPSFLYMVKECNPGSVTDVEIDPTTNVFSHAFYALAASINGFKNFARPVIVVDGTHLKGKYNGIMFVAVTQDGNRQVFPLAIGIGHVEDDYTWTWFLERVRRALDCPENLLIVSDAHKSIGNAVRAVYPEAHHCHCYYHMSTNMKSYGKDMVSLFYQAAFADSVSDYELAFASIRTQSETLFQKLWHIGPAKWARSLCPVRRYEFMTSNAAESFNKSALWARKLPITSVLEVMRAIIERWFYERRTEALSREHEVTQAAANDLIDAIRLGSSMGVDRIDATRFKVRHHVKIFVVDLHERTCSCASFQQMLIPCSHAAAAIRTINHNINAYVGDCFKTSTLRGMWSGIVMPIPDKGSWVVPSDVRGIICLPPDRQRQAGRPRQSRFTAGRSRSASRTTPAKQSCSRCGGKEHNITTCDVLISQPTVTPTQQQKSRAPKKCSLCKSTNHTRRKCPSYVGVAHANIDLQ